CRHAENHAQHSEQRAQLVHHQVFKTQIEVDKELCPVARSQQALPLRRRAHWPIPIGEADAPFCSFNAFSGFTSATSVPSARFSSATRFSVRNLILASTGSNLSPCFT